eukprot:2294145-Amphidinium_carterae.1
MRTDLTASVNKKVYATDATTSWGAVTLAEATDAEALFFWSRKRPRHARMWFAGAQEEGLLVPAPGSGALARDVEKNVSASAFTQKRTSTD